MAFHCIAMFLAVATVINVAPGPDALENAQKEVRALMKKDAAKTRLGGVEVVLADGVYRLGNPIHFTELDSGTNGIPVVWRAANRGKAIISGAVAVEPVGIDWNVPPASLIPAQSRAEIRAYRIGGSEDIPGWRNGWLQGKLTEVPVQVHINGERCKVATWPRDGYARTGLPVTPIKDSYTEWGENWYASFGGDFHVDDTAPLADWAKEPDLWAFGMWRFEWCATTSPVLKVDPVERVMCVDTNQNPYGFLPNMPYSVFNAFSEIRERGDWAIDRKSRTIYIRQVGDDLVDVSLTPNLFTGWDAIHDITFQDLVFEHSRVHAIVFSSAARVTVRASLFRGIGDVAVVIGDKSRNSVVHGCDFFDLGKGAVSLKGGVQKTLTAASNVVENCHIHHYGIVSPIAQPAIILGGVGNRAEHNLIHHFAHQGIAFYGNDHYCGFNILHDGVQYNDDAGMIYCSSYDWSKRGSVCEYNCIFMAGKQPLSSHVQGIYMDGWTSGVTIRGNIINRASQGIYMSGGNDNVVVENLVVNCPRGINLSSLGADSFAKAAALQGEKSFLYKKLLAGQDLYRTDLWRTRYPRLLDILAITNKVDAHNAYWYLCTNNVMCATMGLTVGNKDKVLPTHFIKDNIELAGDPGFIDYEGFNWELRPDAPARKVLPHGTRFAEMGLYDSPWRFSPAVKHGKEMSRPRPIRTEFDQGVVTISIMPPKGGAKWVQLSTATPKWNEYTYEFVAEMDGNYKLGLVGGAGYKTMYDDVCIEGHPEVDGSFEDGGKGWWWQKEEKPTSMGEKGTPHGVQKSDEAASGCYVAMANSANYLVSPPFKVKKGDTIRITLKAKQYIPDFIRNLPTQGVVRVPFKDLKYFGHWLDVPKFQEGFRPDIRRLKAICISSGSWLYPTTADMPHSFEISRLTVE